MSNKIIEIITEPSKIYAGSVFKLKVRVQKDYTQEKTLNTEDNKK